MKFKDKAGEAQLAVLKKYGVLADFSGLEEADLDRAIRCKVATKAFEDMTFAAWCDHLIGPGTRVPIARFETPPAGQNLMVNLLAGCDMVQTLKASDREMANRVKALEIELEDLKKTIEDMPPADRRTSMERSLGQWYRSLRDFLTHAISKVIDVEGHIFVSEQPRNSSHRETIGEIILSALNGLKSFGFYVELTLRDPSQEAPLIIPIVEPHPRFGGQEEHELESYDFTVKDVQADGIRAAVLSRTFEQSLPELKGARFECYVRIASYDRQGVEGIEFVHLFLFLRQLLETMRKAQDHHNRGELRESLVLVQLLSDIAPCLVDDSVPGLRDCQERFYEMATTFAGKHSIGHPNISAGQITEFFFSLQDLQKPF